MTLGEYLTIPGNTLPACLAHFPDVVEAAGLRPAVSFIDVLTRSYKRSEILSLLTFSDDLETVAALTFDGYAEKIMNLRELVADFVNDMDVESHTGTDTTTSNLGRTVTTEDKAADDGAANFAGAYSKGGTIQTETGTPSVGQTYGHTITRSGAQSGDYNRLIKYQNEIRSLFVDALAEFGVLFESAVI